MKLLKIVAFLLLSTVLIAEEETIQCPDGLYKEEDGDGLFELRDHLTHIQLQGPVDSGEVWLTVIFSNSADTETTCEFEMFMTPPNTPDLSNRCNISVKWTGHNVYEPLNYTMDQRNVAFQVQHDQVFVLHKNMSRVFNNSKSCFDESLNQLDFTITKLPDIKCGTVTIQVKEFTVQSAQCKPETEVNSDSVDTGSAPETASTGDNVSANNFTEISAESIAVSGGPDTVEEAGSINSVNSNNEDDSAAEKSLGDVMTEFKTYATIGEPINENIPEKIDATLEAELKSAEGGFPLWIVILVGGTIVLIFIALLYCFLCKTISSEGEKDAEVGASAAEQNDPNVDNKAPAAVDNATIPNVGKTAQKTAKVVPAEVPKKAADLVVEVTQDSEDMHETQDEPRLEATQNQDDE